MHIIYIIIIGFLAGLIARFLAPGPYNPTGFIMTVVLEIIRRLRRNMDWSGGGWYRFDQGAGLIGAVIGAIIVLAIWHFINRNSSIDGPARRF